MSKESTIIGGIAVIALALSLLGLLLRPSAPTTPSTGSSDSSAQYGTLGGSAGAGTVSPVTAYVYPNPSNFEYLRANVLEAETMLSLGGWTVTNGISQTPSIGSCVNAATTTEFAVANPFNATTTVEVDMINLGGNATTTNLQVGTSTSAGTFNGGTGLWTGVSASLINTASTTGSIATSTVYWGISGNTLTQTVNGSGLGFLSAGANTVSKILVGPKEFVVGYATGTSATAGFNGNFSTCAYKLKWQD